MIKANKLWNTWFTVNHVNNVNMVLVKEFKGPIRGRQWLKLQRNDERSKSAQLPNSREKAEFNRSAKMGQNNSTIALKGTKH